jgi:hypothetical protein
MKWRTKDDSAPPLLTDSGSIARIDPCSGPSSSTSSTSLNETNADASSSSRSGCSSASGMPRLSSKSAVSSGWELPATLDAPVSDQLTEVAYSISISRCSLPAEHTPHIFCRLSCPCTRPEAVLVNDLVVV